MHYNRMSELTHQSNLHVTSKDVNGSSQALIFPDPLTTLILT